MRSADHLDGCAFLAPVAASCSLTGLSHLERAWHECNMHDDAWQDTAAVTCQKYGANRAHNFQKPSPKYYASCSARYDRHAQEIDELPCCTAECSITHASENHRTSGSPLCLHSGFACLAGCLHIPSQRLAEASAPSGAGKQGGALDAKPIAAEMQTKLSNTPCLVHGVQTLRQTQQPLASTR